LLMSAHLARKTPPGGPERAAAASPRADDPRVVRTRAAVVKAATKLFLRHGYAGTTMEAIAAEAGVSKRTVYNNYLEKDALFAEIVAGMITLAEDFARELRAELTQGGITAATVTDLLHAIGRRLALAVVNPEVVALRRLLMGEARTFPDLARGYYDRAPGQVIDALAAGFRHLADVDALGAMDAHRAAEQFAYLVTGALLDRAVLVGAPPPERDVIACAREGVETFLARYGARAKDGTAM